MSRIQVVLNYISVTQPIATAIVLSAVPLLYIILRKVLTNLSAPIRELAGPKSVRWLTGSLDSNVWEPDAQDYQIEWTLKYGPVFRYNGFFNVSVTCVADNKLDHPMFPVDQDRCYGSPSIEPDLQCSRVRKDPCGSSGIGSDYRKRLAQSTWQCWHLQRLKSVIILGLLFFEGTSV